MRTSSAAAVISAIIVIGLGSFSFVNYVVQSQTAAFPTYYGQVESIIQANCLGCHVTGGIAPFSLAEPETVQRLAQMIKFVIESNRMPPWPPGPESPEMQNERKLRPEEKATLLAWIAAGAPLGDPSTRPSAPPTQPQPKPVPDRALAMTPYVPNKALSDDYRCFLMDPQFKADTNVIGYEVLPGSQKLVHHVILFTVGPDSVGAAREQDEKESGPGWTCFGGPGLPGNAGLGGSLGAWVPGVNDIRAFPKGTARFMRAGTHIVMQVHYNTVNMTSPIEDVTKVALYFAPEEESRIPLRAQILVAPVEVRCPGPYPTDTNDPCHRSFALQRTMMRDAAEGTHLLCNTKVEDYLNREIGDGSAQETHCDRQVRQNGLALGVGGHMHLRGQSLKIELNPGKPSARIFLSIPRWDFNWQGEYWFKEPIPMQAGDTLRLTCVYDNSSSIAGPDKTPLAPRYLTWGEGTTDEMCLAGVLFIGR
jgi:hypothetical protein